MQTGSALWNAGKLEKQKYDNFASITVTTVFRICLYGRRSDSSVYPCETWFKFISLHAIRRADSHRDGAEEWFIRASLFFLSGHWNALPNRQFSNKFSWGISCSSDKRMLHWHFLTFCQWNKKKITYIQLEYMSLSCLRAHVCVCVCLCVCVKRHCFEIIFLGITFRKTNNYT